MIDHKESRQFAIGTGKGMFSFKLEGHTEVTLMLRGQIFEDIVEAVTAKTIRSSISILGIFLLAQK